MSNTERLNIEIDIGDSKAKIDELKEAWEAMLDRCTEVKHLNAIGMTKEQAAKVVDEVHALNGTIDRNAQ